LVRCGEKSLGDSLGLPAPISCQSAAGGFFTSFSSEGISLAKGGGFESLPRLFSPFSFTFDKYNFFVYNNITTSPREFLGDKQKGGKMQVQEWLKGKFREVTPAALKELAPEEEVDPSTERVVGEVPEGLRPLYILCKLYQQRAARLIDKAFQSIPFYGCPNVNLLRKADNEVTKLECFDSVFWVALRDVLSLWEYDGVGVRKGWKVVILLP